MNAPNEVFRALAASSRRRTAVLGRQVVLASGVILQVSEMARGDVADLQRFYEQDVPWRDAVQACAEADGRTDVRPKFGLRAAMSLSNPGDCVVVARSPFGGSLRVVAAGMLDVYAGAYRPNRLLVAPLFQRKGIGTAVTVAQIEFALRHAQAHLVTSQAHPPEALVKVWAAACSQLGIGLSRHAESGAVLVDLRA